MRNEDLSIDSLMLWLSCAVMNEHEIKSRPVFLFLLADDLFVLLITGQGIRREVSNSRRIHSLERRLLIQHSSFFLFFECWIGSVQPSWNRMPETFLTSLRFQEPTFKTLSFHCKKGITMKWKEKSWSLSTHQKKREWKERCSGTYCQTFYPKVTCFLMDSCPSRLEASA